MQQLDGNVSVTSDSSLNSSFSSNTSFSSLPQTLDQFSPIPTIFSANGRSIFPKFNDLVLKLQNHRIDVAQISETWQDINKKDHNDKIDILEHQLGYKWYSFARPKYRDTGSLTGGGGTAVLVNSRNWLSQHLDDILVPQGLEVVWVKAVPKLKSMIKMVIICGIYSKPNSKKKTILSDHISMNYHHIRAKYPEARFLFLGDFNCYKPDVILHLSPQFRQVVHYPTHNNKILDLIVTDLHNLYHPPIPNDPLLPDHPDLAAPSDHVGNLLIPRSVPGIASRRICKTLTVRPITDSQLSALGRLISGHSWKTLESITDVDTQLDFFTSSMFCMLDIITPQKVVKIALSDPHG